MYDDKDIPSLKKVMVKETDVMKDDHMAVLSSWDLSMGIINALVGKVFLIFFLVKTFFNN